MKIFKEVKSRNFNLEANCYVQTWDFTSPPISSDNLKKDWIFPLRNYKTELIK